jgi:hypothetical protein
MIGIMKSSELGPGHAGASSRWVARVVDPRVLILTVAALVLTNIPLAGYRSGWRPGYVVWSSLSVLLALWQFWRHGRISWAALTVATAFTVLLYGLSIAGVMNLGLPGWWIPITSVANILALAILLSSPIRRWVAKQPRPSALARLLADRAADAPR